MNPATTLTFYRLGKIEAKDAVFYVIAQFAGGLLGVLVSSALLGRALSNPAVHFVATVPPAAGATATALAFAAEGGIAFILMSVILTVSNTPRIAKLTGLCAGALVALYIAFEAPVSGMSMNPARTFASALPAMEWHAIWIYFTAPPIGMLLAAEVFLRSTGKRGVICAKLYHTGDVRCIFRCGSGNTAFRRRSDLARKRRAGIATDKERAQVGRTPWGDSLRECVMLAPPAITMAVAEI